MIDAIEMRPAELLLDWDYNPAQGGPHAVPHTPKQIIEAVGIIPDIYTEACGSMVDAHRYPESTAALVRPVPMHELARAMDEVYGYGGFAYPYDGTITDRGVYVSAFDEDPALYPLVRLIYKGFPKSLGQFELYIYPYAICALRDRESLEVQIARFD
jgi:hypothetical protein